jgi:hypothetical protein
MSVGMQPINQKSTFLYFLMSEALNTCMVLNPGRDIFIRETQISKTQCIEIFKSNNPAEGGGFNTPQPRLPDGQVCCGISFSRVLVTLGFHTRDCHQYPAACPSFRDSEAP